MFSLLEGGWKKPTITSQITFGLLQWYIKNHPHQDKILHLHTLEKGCEEYNQIKSALPCVKPHGEFENYGVQKNFKQFSGYIFFDIDHGDIESIREKLMTEHRDKIALLGKSVGGSGLFFYVRIQNKDVLTKDNFIDVQNYLIQNVFGDINIDLNAKGICRNQVIPYDKDVFINENASILLPKNEKGLIQRNLQRVTQSIKKEEKRQYRSSYTFLPINELVKKLKIKTEVNVIDEVFDIRPVEYASFYIPKEITNTKKHKTFRAMIHHLVYFNPDVTLLEVLSYINYVNENYTGPQKMDRKKMINLVEYTYQVIKETGVLHVKTRVKRIHFNPDCRLSGDEKRAIANRENGKLKVESSKALLIETVKDMKAFNMHVTQATVAEQLEGQLSLSSIKKYWYVLRDLALLKEREKDNTTIDTNKEIDAFKEDYSHPELCSLEYYIDMYSEELGIELFLNQKELVHAC